MSGLRRPFLCDRFFFVTVKEHHEKAQYIHLNPVRRGLVTGPDEWMRSGMRYLLTLLR